MHIIGAGGHAKVIVDILLSAKRPILGIWTDNELSGGFLNYNVAGSVGDFIKEASNQYIIAIGNNIVRKKIAARLINTLTTAVHHRSVIGMGVQIGNGTVVMANASINIGCTIGSHAIINTNASVDHDCKIADFVHISPQVGLAGNIEVGEGTHIGIGASIIPNISIGKWAIIGAGAVIIKDVPDYAVVVGNSGKIIRYNEY